MERGWSGTMQGMCCAQSCARPLLLEGIFVSKHSSKNTPPCYLPALNPQVCRELNKVPFITANTWFKILGNCAGRKKRPKSLDLQ